MSSEKRGGGANPIYASHLFGNMYQFNPQVNRQQVIGQMLANRITELAVNRFKWENLPPSIDPRFLEMTLFYQACAIYYHDDNYDKDLVVQGSGKSYVNVLDNPVAFTVIAPGTRFTLDGQTDANVRMPKSLSAYDPARHKDLPEEVRRKKAIPIWANYLRVPEMEIVNIYASRLATMDTSIEINSENARRNKVLTGPANTNLSLVNIARSLKQGEDIYMVQGAMPGDIPVEAIDLGVPPESYEKLHILRTRTWNECMGLLGIDNANQDKKERLVAAEVGANDSQTDSMRYVALNARRYAVEQINDVFGTNISVDFNTEIEAEEDAEKAQKAQEQQNNNDNDKDSGKVNDNG